MTETNQEKTIAALAEVWALAPDLRLGQLMAHLGFLGEVHRGVGLGDMDDDAMVEILARHRVELTARLQPEPTGSLQLR